MHSHYATIEVVSDNSEWAWMEGIPTHINEGDNYSKREVGKMSHQLPETKIMKKIKLYLSEIIFDHTCNTLL